MAIFFIINLSSFSTSYNFKFVIIILPYRYVFCRGQALDARCLTLGLYLISTYPFKNLGFMRFPEPVFAGIYQNILTTAVFRAC